MLFFLFLFILVHSIIKNGEKRDKRYVKIRFASSSILGGNKHKSAPAATFSSCEGLHTWA